MPVGIPAEVWKNGKETPPLPSEVVHIVVTVQEVWALNQFLYSLAIADPQAKIVAVWNGTVGPLIDKSKEFFKDLKKEFPSFEAYFIRHDQNYGLPKAVRAAYEFINDNEKLRKIANYVMVHNDDCICAKNLNSLLRYYTDERIAMVFPTNIEPSILQLTSTSPQANTEQFNWYAEKHSATDVGDVEATGNGSWLISRKKIAEVGGKIFDDDLYPVCWCEDWDLYERVLEKGYYIGRTPEVLMYHYSCTTHRQLADQSFKQKNMQTYLNRWPNGEWRKRQNV